MSILRVPFDHACEIFNCLLMIVYHLVGFCTLMLVPDVSWDPFNASTKWPNRLFKLLDAAVCQTYVVINVRFECQERFVPQSFFQGLNRLLVFLIIEISQTKFVKNL